MADKTKIPASAVTNILALLKDGATISFIARPWRPFPGRLQRWTPNP
ncbi:MAG: hypothetical protein R6V55_05365 [Desulfovermiculus sp.]